MRCAPEALTPTPFSWGFGGDGCNTVFSLVFRIPTLLGMPSELQYTRGDETYSAA